MRTLAEAFAPYIAVLSYDKLPASLLLEYELLT